MSPVERRRIDELVAMYQLEPEIRDVFVEGALDKALVDWFFFEGQLSNATVREIDTVDVPVELVESAGFAKNNRGRVMALARELEAKLLPGTVSATCVIDSDFDWILNETHHEKLLVSTDYSSMELYFFDVRPLTKFLRLAVQRFPKSADTVLSELRKALTELFAIRLASHVLAWGVPLVSFERCCRLTEAGVELDTAEYIKRCLLASGRYAERAEFNRVFSDFLAKFTGDPRKHIHGHDFISLLAWYVRQHKGQNVSETFLERSLLSCADFHVLREETLFGQLLSRAAA
jgi:hypothetical protein